MSRVIIIYWIYTANNCGMLFSWGVSVCPLGTIVECCSVKGVYVCPLGTGLENVHSTVSGVVNVWGGERRICWQYISNI